MTPRQALDDLIREREETYAAVSRLLGRNSAYIQQYIKRGDVTPSFPPAGIRAGRLFCA